MGRMGPSTEVTNVGYLRRWHWGSLGIPDKTLHDFGEGTTSLVVNPYAASGDLLEFRHS